MGHYAYLDENNVVVTVTVGKDKTETINGLDTEAYYALGTPYIVKRTSYNGRIRFNYAGIGYVYDPIRDAFIPPKCHNEAVIDETTCLWSCDNDDHKLKVL